ncbi:hypothetical protein [Mycolicibacterium sp. HK-90]|uniref:hypothetical protein n=1 Tax=Mycolicibacterium sp. HK-90 TaxID=3056937 RepID=UPI00265A57F3|nr:hypothetical protein [Mycolicibacterium sp. HK-90]WKG03337.1 hypothetical protein QU592_29880 [Mycolicibacterium sp. HK-90]
MKHSRKNAIIAGLGAVAAGAAAPAVLFAGTGAAQAATVANPTAQPFGVNVHITSAQPDPSWGLCSYTAIPVAVPNGVIPPAPAYNVPFYLLPFNAADLWFPGVKTGTTWNVTVTCEHGTDSPVQQVVY